jgi:hypothetical protein
MEKWISNKYLNPQVDNKCHLKLLENYLANEQFYLHYVWQRGKISGRTSHMLNISHWSHEAGQDNLPLQG